MKTVKQILGESQAIDYTDRLSVLSSLGLLEESKVGLVRRSLEKNPMSMTMAESKALKEFVDNILSQMLLEKQDYLSKFDKRVPKGYPSDRDMPTVLILKRKAIRVYPDNQKIALYYSQALDRYISIPFNGARGEPLGMVMNEETERLNELYGMRRSEEEEAKKKEEIMRAIAGMRTKEGQLDTVKMSSFIKELPKTDLHLLPKGMKLRDVMPSDSGQDIAYMAGVATRRSLNKLVRRVAGRKKLPDQVQGPAKPEDVVKKGPVQGPGTSYGMFGEGSVSDRFRSNVQMIREGKISDFAYGDLDDFSLTSIGKDVTPGLGTARAAERTRQSYQKGNYGMAALNAADTAISGLSDAALATGAGALVSGGIQGIRTGIKGGSKLLGRLLTKNSTTKTAKKTAKKTAEKIPSSVDRQQKVLDRLNARRAKQGKKPVTKKDIKRRNRLRTAADIAALGATALGGALSGKDGDPIGKELTPAEFKGINPNVSGPGMRATLDMGPTAEQLRRFGTVPGGYSSGTAGWQQESNLSIIRKLSRSKSLLEQKINFLDENDLTINRGAAKKIMKVYNSLNESNKGKMEKMLNESVVTFTQAINFAVRQ